MYVPIAAAHCFTKIERDCSKRKNLDKFCMKSYKVSTNSMIKYELQKFQIVCKLKEYFILKEYILLQY